MQEKKISKPLPSLLPKIREPDEWARLTAAGIQVADENGERNLVRLIDVAEWLSQSYPRDQVLRRIFDPTAGLAASDWAPLTLIYLLKADTSPVRLMDRFQPNDEAGFFWERLDGVDYFSSPDAVGASLQEAWEWAWPGAVLPGADPEWDKEFQWRQADREEEGQVMLGYLKRLAIDASLAHLLWGWGTPTVAANLLSEPEMHPTGDVVEQPTAAIFPFPDLAPVVDIQDPKTWRQLVHFRRSHPRARWTDSMRAIALREKKDRASKPGARGVVDAMAADLHITPKVLNEQILKASRNNGASPSRRVGIHK